jgi:hypothetical protein
MGPTGGLGTLLLPISRSAGTDPAVTTHHRIGGRCRSRISTILHRVQLVNRIPLLAYFAVMTPTVVIAE